MSKKLMSPTHEFLEVRSDGLWLKITIAALRKSHTSKDKRSKKSMVRLEKNKKIESLTYLGLQEAINDLEILLRRH